MILHPCLNSINERLATVNKALATGTPSGVYVVCNTQNSKVYVGSSVNCKRRLRGHRNRLQRQEHHSQHLQAAWNKYGKDAFVFLTVERCLPEECLEREQKWLDGLQAANRDFGYNSSPTAGNSLGVRHSKEHKRKRSKWMKQRYKDKEQRELTGKATRDALADPEVKARSSAAVKALWQSKEYRCKMLAIRRAEGFRNSASAQVKELWKDENYRKNFSAKVAGKRSGEDNANAKLTEETVREARQRSANGELTRVIAADLGVGFYAVHRAIRRITWANVV